MDVLSQLSLCSVHDVVNIHCPAKTEKDANVSLNDIHLGKNVNVYNVT